MTEDTNVSSTERLSWVMGVLVSVAMLLTSTWYAAISVNNLTHEVRALNDKLFETPSVLVINDDYVIMKDRKGKVFSLAVYQEP